jgi:hypothetical protein
MQRCAPLLFVLALMGAAVSVPSTALAQREPSVCFYEHVNFQGRAYCIRVGERVGFVGGRANDQFSSVRLPRGAVATMCEHSNFRGRCSRLHRSEPSFVPLGFNDKVSAVAAQWERRGGPGDWDRRRDGDRDWRRDDRNSDRGRDRDRGRDDDGRRGDGQVCFYEHDHYRGRRFCAPVGRAVPWVGRNDNDKFSAVRIPRGVTVTVCRDRDFRGPCRSYRSDVDFFGGDWNDTISSFRSH